MTEPLLDGVALHRAFSLVAERLQRKGVVGEIHIFGGAAMVLVFRSRLATRDVDAIFTPDGAVRDAADHAARLLGLPRSWLNNQASGYVSRTPGRGVPVVDHPHLRVVATNPEHLLAMKVRAARAVRDADDIRVLIVHLNMLSLSEIRAVVHRYFPDEPLSARSLELVSDILREVRGVVDGR